MFAKTIRPTNVRARVGSRRSGSSASATVRVPPALAGPWFAVPPPPLPVLVVLEPPHPAAIRAAATAAAAHNTIRRMVSSSQRNGTSPLLTARHYPDPRRFSRPRRETDVERGARRAERWSDRLPGRERKRDGR